MNPVEAVAKIATTSFLLEGNELLNDVSGVGPEKAGRPEAAIAYYRLRVGRSFSGICSNRAISK